MFAGLVIVAVGCGQPEDAGSTPIGTATPGRSPLAPASTPSPAEIEEARRFRESFGLRADDAWIVAVARNPSSQEGAALFSTPLLPFESRELMARTEAYHEAGPVVLDYARTVPDDWYGSYIDQQRGGIIVAQFFRNTDRHREVLARLLPPSARWEVRQVDQRTLDTIAFVARVKADRAWFATIDAELLDVVTNPMDGGIVELTYLSHSRDLDPVIRERYEDPPWLLVERAGGSPWTGPRGDVVVRAVDLRGDPVPGLTCDLGGDTVSTDRAGTCRFEYLGPGGFALELWAGAVGSRHVAFTEVTVQPGRSTAITVVVREP
jgi:hypothetical protein